MDITINNTNPTFGMKYVVRGWRNKQVPYLYNKVSECMKGQGIPASFNLGKDIITLSAETKEANLALTSGFKQHGIKFTKRKS